MKKLFSMGIVLFFLLTLFTSCQSPGPEQDLGDKFILGEDNQYYFYLSGARGTPLAESEDYYYFIKDGWYLSSQNKETGEIVPLCNKPDCTHDENSMNSDGSSNCNAFFGSERALDYYHGKIYLEGGDSKIYEVDSSGTTRKELLSLKENLSFMMVHRGYLYLSFTDYQMGEEQYTEEQMKDMSYRVERYCLDQWDGKPEIVYEKKGEWGQINAMFAYGIRAYFIVSGSAETVIYNLLDHSHTEIQDTVGYSTVINGKLLYFKMAKGQQDDMSLEEKAELKSKNMAILAKPDGTPIENTEISEVYEGLYGSNKLLATDNYLFTSFGLVPEEDRGIRLYDKDMNFIREIKLENGTMPSLGMNEDYFFYMKRLEETGEVQIWALDLHKLDDPDLKGEPFFVSEE